jgi:hypothetical protein
MPSNSSKIMCLFIISILWIFSIAYCATDPHCFDPFLKSNWYGVYLQGAKLGYMENSLEKVSIPYDGWKSHSLMTFAMKLGKDQANMTVDDIRYYKSPNGELDSSIWITSSPTGNIEVYGKRKSGKFIIDSDIGGQRTEKTFPYPLDNLDSTLTMERYISTGKAILGDSLNFATFEPTPPLTGLIHQTVKILSKKEILTNGVPTTVYSLSLFIEEANITLQSTVDSCGNLIDGTVGSQMEIKLEGEDLAKKLENTYDLFANNLVIADKNIVDPKALNKLELKISGIDSTSIIETFMQKGRPDNFGNMLVEINKGSIPTSPAMLPITNDDMKPFLQSDPYEQSDDPKIIALADSIVGSEKNSWAAARKINNWVYKNIRKQMTPDFSNALQTLNSRRGDCGEHTALAVALLRASGIPARPIVGLIYWPPGEAFGYHAWTEVYVGRWIEMDPTWNEYLANPTHIAFARGDIMQQVSAIYKIMGKIKISILSAE